MNHVTRMIDQADAAAKRFNAMLPRYERGPDIEMPDLTMLQDAPHPALLERLDTIAGILERIADALEVARR